MTTKIEWTEETWNPVTGCTPISEGCAHCYAKRMARRLAGRCGYPRGDGFEVTLHPDRLDQPLRWKKPRRVFVCSMGDLFHERVPFYGIADVFHTMMGECSGEAAPRHIYQLLTKRPWRALDFFAWLAKQDGHDEAWLGGLGAWMRYQRALPSYIWLGVTAENQARADERIPLLLQTPAAVRFVSVEPMLGSVDMDFGIPCAGQPANNVDWVICGGETGPGARPMDPGWARDLRDQCRAADVPFFMKKMSGGGQPPADLMVREYLR